MEDYTSTFLSLNSLWKDGNKSEFSRLMQDSLSVAADPYKMVSVCIKLCPDLFKNRSSGMPANIIVEFMSFLGKGNYPKYEHCLNEALQVDMFQVAVRQKNVGLMRLFVKAFQLERIKMLLLPHIKDMGLQGQLKEVATLATLLNLQDEFSTEDLIVPLFLQDRLSLADEFLLTSPRHQKEILSFIDSIIGKQVNINDLHKTYKIKDPKKVKSSKMLCNTVAKLLKKFDLDASICPHMQKHRARGALRYIFYKYYIEKGIQVQAFQSLIDDALKESPHLGPDLMHLFDEYHDLEAAAPYVRKLQLHPDDIPVRIKEVISAKPHLTDGNMDVAAEKQLEEECWDDGRLDFYSLNVPLEEVVIVTSVEEFTKCMSVLTESPVIAMDSEWKPTFGIGSAEQASLLQMASQSRVFLLDLVALQPLLEDSHWSCIGQLFSNPKITKIGYGIRGDFKILAKLHSEVQKGFANAKNVVDLDQIKGILVEDYPDIFPHSSSNYKGLTDLVYRCFGLPLDKTDQFSNWAARPLTKSQIRYATMDVVSLIDIYTFLDKKAQELNIEDWQNIRPKKGKEKVKKDRPVRKQIPNTYEDMQMKVMNKEPILAADFHVICDTMVQGLAKKLRCFGIDAEALETGESCDKCIEYYEKEKRVVMTKGSAYERLAKFIPSSFIYKVQKESANQQVEEIINVFNVKVTTKDIFARCPKCNSASYLFVPSSIIRALKDIDVNMTEGVPDKWVQCEGGEVNLSTGNTRQGVPVLVARIADGIISRTKTFYVCAQCGRCYWDGSHYEKIINGRLSDVVQEGGIDCEELSEG